MRAVPLASCLLLTACATASGEIGMRVDTQVAIARLEFARAQDGTAIHVAAIPAGRSEQVAKVRPGQWCLVEYVIARGNVGVTGKPPAPICAEVREGTRADVGLLVFDGNRLRRLDEPANSAVPDDDPSPAPGEQADPASTLSTQQVKAGMVAIKPAVFACMTEHGLPPDAKLMVQVSIEGSSGRVTEARPLSPFADSPIAPCLAEAFADARFPTFAARHLGVVYPFRR